MKNLTPKQLELLEALILADLSDEELATFLAFLDVLKD